MEKNRLEAFSDGVLAIIITIMVLELRQPLGDTFSDFWELAPTLLAYFVSFFFIAIYWVNHHHLFHTVGTINVKVLWCNIGWLFVMSFIPFATAWVGTYQSSWAPLTVYFADMVLACITFHLMSFFIARENGEKFHFGLRSILSLAIYMLAALLGGFCPIAAFVAVALISASWLIPEKKKNGADQSDIPYEEKAELPDKESEE